MQRTPRILVISHNVFSNTTAMGKTLSSMLGCVPRENLAQLYFHSEVPTTDICHNYLRIRDQDVLKSIVTRCTRGAIFDEKRIQRSVSSTRTDRGLIAGIYQLGRKRTPVIYCLRNAMWCAGAWNSPELKTWLDDFAPDLIFFASGDYAFAYRIVYTISKEWNIPVVLWCCDDYYFSHRFNHSSIGRFCHRNLMKWVKRVSERTKLVVVISDKMKRDYGEIFPQPIEVIRISAAPAKSALPFEQRKGIVYAGGLGVNRVVPLVELGRSLKSSALTDYEAIDVYSGDKNPKTLAQLTPENGIRFHGQIPAQEMSEVLSHAKYMLHVEAFDEASKARTRYSLSTKIGELLCSGACILAYGPQDISSMEYLTEKHAAAWIGASDEIAQTIAYLDGSPETVAELLHNAQALAEQNHSKEINDEKARRILCSVTKEERAL